MNDVLAHLEQRGACLTAIRYGEAHKDDWFPERGDTVTSRKARAICATCEVKQECLVWSLKHVEYGIWGGMTEGARRKLRYRSRDCLQCGDEFTILLPKAGGSLPGFCSDECRDAARTERRVS